MFETPNKQAQKRTAEEIWLHIPHSQREKLIDTCLLFRCDVPLSKSTLRWVIEIAMAANKSTGAFTGIFTLKSQADAQRLANAVKGVVDKSVNIFFRLSKEADAAKELIDDIQICCELCAQFPEICSMQDTYVFHLKPFLSFLILIFLCFRKTAADEAIRKLLDQSSPILTVRSMNNNTITLQNQPKPIDSLSSFSFFFLVDSPNTQAFH